MSTYNNIFNDWFFKVTHPISDENGKFIGQFRDVIVFLPSHIDTESAGFPWGLCLSDGVIYDGEITDSLCNDLEYLLDKNLKKVEKILSEITPDALNSTTFCYITNDNTLIITNDPNKPENTLYLDIYDVVDSHLVDEIDHFVREAFREYFNEIKEN